MIHDNCWKARKLLKIPGNITTYLKPSSYIHYNKQNVALWKMMQAGNGEQLIYYDDIVIAVSP